MSQSHTAAQPTSYLTSNHLCNKVCCFWYPDGWTTVWIVQTFQLKQLTTDLTINLSLLPTDISLPPHWYLITSNLISHYLTSDISLLHMWSHYHTSDISLPHIWYLITTHLISHYFIWYLITSHLISHYLTSDISLPHIWYLITTHLISHYHTSMHH